MADQDTILETTKRQCNIDSEDTSYDLEIITHINTVFFILQQLGIGPAMGFSLIDGTEKWSEFVGADGINAVRTYMGLRVKMLFDPPATGPATEAMERQAAQLEWRLNIHMEGVRWDAAQMLSSQSTELG
jgi:hypothetical protein